MNRLFGRKILITGGSQGIGRALVEGFCREGASVVFTFNKSDKAASELIESMTTDGHKVLSIKIDCSDVDQAPRLIEQSAEFLNGLDVLLNNVGMIRRTSFADITKDELKFIFDVNFNFPFFLTQSFIKLFFNSQQEYQQTNEQLRQQDKSVINISSLSAESAISRVSHYQCSKAALSMLTKSVAMEVAQCGIRVNTISPGLTSTEGNRQQREMQPEVWANRSKHIPLGRPGHPLDHVGAAVYFASTESMWVTGANLMIDGGQSII